MEHCDIRIKNEQVVLCRTTCCSMLSALAVLPLTVQAAQAGYRMALFTADRQAAVAPVLPDSRPPVVPVPCEWWPWWPTPVPVVPVLS